MGEVICEVRDQRAKVVAQKAREKAEKVDKKMKEGMVHKAERVLEKYAEDSDEEKAAKKAKKDNAGGVFGVFGFKSN